MFTSSYSFATGPTDDFPLLICFIYIRIFFQTNCQGFNEAVAREVCTMDALDTSALHEACNTLIFQVTRIFSPTSEEALQPTRPSIFTVTVHVSFSTHSSIRCMPTRVCL